MVASHRPCPSNRPCLPPQAGLRIATVLLAVLLPVLTSGCFSRKQTTADPNGTTSSDPGESEAALSSITDALAATENLETESAARKWNQLRRAFPDAPSIALNEALNAVLRVDQLTAAATDSVKSTEEKQAARRRLPEVLSSADAAIRDYVRLSGDTNTGIWLTTRIDAHEATLLGTTVGKSLRRESVQALIEAINQSDGAQSGAVILGGPLIELLEQLSDPIDGLPAEFLQPAADALTRLSDQNPDNLYLAIAALRLAIEAEKPFAAKLVDRTWQLARAVEPTLAAYTKPIGMTPQQLTDQIQTAVNQSDWAGANQSFTLWSNVLNPLEIVRSDRRRASPHPLDRLDFSAVRRWSAQIASANPIQAESAETWVTFEDVTVDRDAVAVLPIDADLDLQTDLIVARSDGSIQWLQFEEDRWTTTANVTLDVQPAGLAVADLFMVDSSAPDRIKQSTVSAPTADQDYSLKARHNTLQTLIVYGDFGIQLVQIDSRESTTPEARLSVIKKQTGLEDVGSVALVVAGDLEGDGDLDLVVAPQAGSLTALINRGNRTFFPAPIGTVTVAEDDPVVDMAIGDLDRDIDLDVATIHRSGKIGLLENLLHLQFRLRYLDQVPPLRVASVEGQPDPALSVAIEDIDSNVAWDIVATSTQQSVVAFAHSSDIGVWNVDRVETARGFESRPALADFDNDSYFEWVGPNRVVRLGPWGINRVSEQSPIASDQNFVGHADMNGDGSIDLVTLQDEAVWIGLNQDRDGHQVTVRFKGIADNAASSGRVNHYAIGSVLELRFGPHYRSRIVTGPQTHFGLGDVASADTIRVIMPNGLTQTIRDVAVDSLIEEEQTLKGSCPYLYSWDGEKFTFVTDCLWAAPLGLQVAAGVVQKDRPWEYLKIDGDHVHQNADGRYELRLTEELWEVAYLDHVQLTAIDHPVSTDVFTNEKVGPPSIAKPTIYSFDAADRVPPRQATATDGNDVTGLLSDVDERYVQGFDRRIRQGLCPPHWIDLDFGDAARQRLASTPDGSVYLVLTGWILPTDTSLNIQIDQNPELPAIEFPSVWVPDEDFPSKWQQAIPFMGFPGGKTKTIVVDVTEHVIREDPRFRIRTSAQIYWDAASLAVASEPATFVRHEVPLVAAEVAFHGFSKRIKPDAVRPETYVYASADKQPKWPPLRGAVTQFGDCLDLLHRWDDAMVVISGGDEVRMTFAVPAENPPPGWRRDFVLHCVGWDKDADLNTLTGQSIGPLPIRDMRSYPPTVDSKAAFDAVQKKNADALQRIQSFRGFWRRDGRSELPFLRTDLGGLPRPGSAESSLTIRQRNPRRP